MGSECHAAPKSRIEKLGVKPQMRVSVLGIDDAALVEEIRGRGANVAVGRALVRSDIVFLGLSAVPQLSRLDRARRAIHKDGAIWVVWPKGRKEFREDHVREYGKGIGLVDVKVVRVSERLSGLKMVVPLKLR